MRLVASLSLILLVNACGGGKDGDDSGIVLPTCDEEVTVAFSSLTPDEWPTNMEAGVVAVQNLEGTWQGTSCGDDKRKIVLKITEVPRVPEETQAILEPVPDTVDCGCSYDPRFGADNTLDAVARMSQFMVFVEFDPLDEWDPGVDNHNFEVEGALFGGTQGLLFRACGQEVIAPADGSSFDRANINLRLEMNPSGTPMADEGLATISIILDNLTEDRTTAACTIDDLVKIL